MTESLGVALAEAIGHAWTIHPGLGQSVLCRGSCWDNAPQEFSHYTIGSRYRPRQKGAGNVGKSLDVFAILEVDSEKMRERRKEVQMDDRYHH